MVLCQATIVSRPHLQRWLTQTAYDNYIDSETEDGEKLIILIVLVLLRRRRDPNKSGRMGVLHKSIRLDSLSWRTAQGNWERYLRMHQSGTWG